MKKTLLSFILIICLAFALTACGGARFDESKGEFVIGLECDYAPFNWTETTATDTNVPIYGQSGLYAEGYDIQMARRICQDLGYTLVVKKIAWEGLIPALESGDIDAIIAGMSPTEERKESIDFTEPYYASEHVVIVKADGPFASATRFTDFATANIVGQKGTVFADLADQLAEKAGTTAMTPLATVPLIVSGILLGDTDVTVVEKPVALGICTNNPSLKWIKLADEFEVDPTDVIVSIGVRKVDKTLQEKVNAALAKITAQDRENLMTQAVNNSPQE